MYSSLDIWGNEHTIFKQWMCIGFDKITTTTYPVTSSNVFQYTSTQSNQIKITDLLSLTVDNIEVELPSITILIIANTKRFYGNESTRYMRCLRLFKTVFTS